MFREPFQSSDPTPLGAICTVLLRGRSRDPAVNGLLSNSACLTEFIEMVIRHPAAKAFSQSAGRALAVNATIECDEWMPHSAGSRGWLGNRPTPTFGGPRKIMSTSAPPRFDSGEPVLSLRRFMAQFAELVRHHLLVDEIVFRPPGYAVTPLRFLPGGIHHHRMRSVKSLWLPSTHPQSPIDLPQQVFQAVRLGDATALPPVACRLRAC